jgi:hypothetical protein
MCSAARAFLIAAGIFAVCLLHTEAANAQQSRNPNVTAFLANPAQLLQQNPEGGLKLTDAVQELALADTSTFKILLGLLGSANDLQKSAIGAGLAQAAKIEVLTDQTVAADWQQQIASINDPSFKMAATNSFGDVKIGALGGSPLGGTGTGPGLGAPQATGSAQSISSSGVATGTFTITSSVGPASSPPASPAARVSP